MKMAALAGIMAAAMAIQDPPRPRPFPGSTTAGTQTTPPRTTADPQGTVDPGLGLPRYPGATLVATYDASPNQQMHIYGSSAVYATVVEFYRTALKDKGRALFGGPMHQFDIGRYRRETMTLQPALTVKDYTWNGRDGYVHVSGRQIVKYPTIIQIVTAPPAR